MARRVVASVVAVVVAGVLATVAFAQDEPEPEERTTVRIALNGYENNLTPFTATLATFPKTIDLLTLVYDTLFWSPADQDPEPWLAESATPSEDGTEWTVRLRPDLRWHDGEALTAEDVAFSFEYWSTTAPPGRWTHHVTDVPPFEEAEVIDERTVRLRFGAPAPTFKILPGGDLPMVPEHIWADIEEPRQATDDLPVGSGPFKLVEIVPDQSYRFVANEDYFKGPPLVDELQMPIVEDTNAAFQALAADQVDLVTQNVPPQVVERFESADDIEVVRGSRFESTGLRFNTQNPPLDDPALRKAISLAIDHQDLVDRILQGDGRPGNDSWIHPDSAWALPGADHEFDPERARRMLDEAGYGMGPDGVRLGPDDEPLEFTVLVSSLDTERLRAIQLVAGQVEEVGVRLVPEALDPATITQRTDPPAPGEPPRHDAEMGGFGLHAHTDPDNLYYFFHSPGPRGIGTRFTGYSNPQFDRLTEEATTLSAEDRKPVLHEAQRIFAEEVPQLTFWYREGVYAYRPAAYAGWITDPGHGIFTKRSFLEPYADTDAASAVVPGDGDATWIVVVVVLVLGAAVAVGVVVMRRRRGASEGFE